MSIILKQPKFKTLALSASIAMGLAACDSGPGSDITNQMAAAHQQRHPSEPSLQ